MLRNFRKNINFHPGDPTAGSGTRVVEVGLDYGLSGKFSCDFDASRVVALHNAPPPSAGLTEEIRKALEHPLDFPPLEQLCIPGDHVVLALDRHTPQAPELISEIWQVLERRGVEADTIQILQPVALETAPLPDPRTLLPPEVRSQVRWTIHDPTDEKKQAYLATTARGERIYLDRECTDADVVISVGSIAYDSVLGHRGTNSVFYPGLSTIDSISRARGEGHSELGPDDERPLRQTIDEVAWLLGTQFTVQVIPAGGSAAATVLAGAYEPVFRHGKKILEEMWQVRLLERAETIVVAIDADSAGHGWDQVGAALATARNLVSKGGRVIVLTELEGETGDGLNLIRQSRSPRNALQPIRKQAPLDMIPATQLATIADWAHLYLVSKLPADVVDELFMSPLENVREVERLVNQSSRCVFIGSAQHCWGEVVPETRSPIQKSR